MKKLVTFWLLFSMWAGAEVNKPQGSLVSFKKGDLFQQMEKALKQSGVSSQYIGAIVAGDSYTLYQLNDSKSFIPASLIKIWLAGALLDLLSPSLTWSTQFRASSPVENNTLKGSLYLKGGGDPGFVSESLWNLVNNLTRTGLKVVTGDLIVDSSHFDQEKRGPRLKHSSSSSYDAPVSALSFNWNTVNIYLQPGKKVGQALRLILDPSSLYFTSIDNQTVTASPNTKKQLRVQRQKTGYDRESLVIKGKMPLGSKETLIYQNILHPSIWTGWNALTFLKQRGIEVKGQVRKGQVPHSSVLLAQWQSQPLTDQIKLMMKYSNNFMVEMLVKNMATVFNRPKSIATHHLSSYYGARAFSFRGNKLSKGDDLKAGIEIIKTYLHKRGFSEKDYTLVQPSGLSRQNRVQPRHFMQFLKYWLNHPLQPEFESTFPLVGEEGTFKKYFQSPGLKNLKGHVRAKTGSLNGVTGLAGYLITKTGKKQIFVFIFNGPDSKKRQVKALFKTWLITLWN